MGIRRYQHLPTGWLCCLLFVATDRYQDPTTYLHLSKRETIGGRHQLLATDNNAPSSGVDAGIDDGRAARPVRARVGHHAAGGARDDVAGDDEANEDHEEL